MKKFTLLELLIVIAVIGILLSLLLPSLGKAKYSVRKAVCASNQRQAGTGVLLFTKDYDKKFPDVQNHHNKAPYTTRVAYWTKTNKWYNLGKVYKKEYVSTGETFYCPQNAINGTTKLTFEYNSNEEKELEIHSGDYYIRVSYHLLPNKMSTTARRNLLLSKLESDDLFMSENIESKNSVAHRIYKTGWNITKIDSSVKFKYSQTAWSLIQAGSLSWDWDKAEKVKKELLK